jgi:predicted phage terminase large subunit-like protein
VAVVGEPVGLDTPPEEIPSRKVRLAIAAAQLTKVKYCPESPHPKQRQFLLNFTRETLFGGAAGPGKSSAILMAALQFVDVPGYAALLLRKSYIDLSQPGAIMDRADGWFRGLPRLRWDDTTHTWTFPSGATLTFGYIERQNDHLKYQGAEYQFVGFDELTQHREKHYRYLFSRLRKPDLESGHPLADVPIRMRSTANPGGPGHEWVYNRFVLPYLEWKRDIGPRPVRDFIPATLEDNPSVNREDYTTSLAELDPVTRSQLLAGDWEVRPEGRMFRASWFWPLAATDHRADLCATAPTIRFWDLAATEPSADNDPDFTAGCLLHRLSDGLWVIGDMVTFRKGPAETERMILATAERDGPAVIIGMEQEPGASGKTLIRHFRELLDHRTFYGLSPSGSKITRSMPIASRADAGDVAYIPGGWIDHFRNEIEIFPDGFHDDQVDALSGAYAMLARDPRLGALLTAQANEGVIRPSAWRM